MAGMACRCVVSGFGRVGLGCWWVKEGLWLGWKSVIYALALESEGDDKFVLVK